MDNRLLDEDAVAQICFVTDDLERSLAWFADLTGKTPSHIGKGADPDRARAVYHGKPATVGCRLAISSSPISMWNSCNPDPKKAPGAICSRRRARVATTSPSRRTT